jgi:L-methionine (R)-S-oxide reductase
MSFSSVIKIGPPGEESRMYEFRIEAADKAELYRQLIDSADALTEGEPDGVANMANVAALLWETLPDLNWAGFYRNVGGELVLGPFQGRAACIRIPFGKGVCGTAAATLEPQCVADVHAFPGHIACDAASRSELVVPIILDGRLLGVLDLDSPLPSRFDEQDLEGCVRLAQRLAPRLAGVANPAEQR